MAATKTINKFSNKKRTTKHYTVYNMIFTKPSITLTATLIILLVFSLNIRAQIAHPPQADNQRSKVCQWMGEVEVCVTYNSPDVTSPLGRSKRGENERTGNLM